MKQNTSKKYYISININRCICFVYTFLTDNVYTTVAIFSQNMSLEAIHKVRLQNVQDF